MNEKTKDLVWAALFLAIGIVIPYVFHVTSLPGQIFLPMHIPVLLCGVILGKKYGLILGILLPFVNSVLLGMPAIFPTGVSMAFELATYGIVTGLLYKDKKYNIFISLIVAMVVGRIVSGVANYILLTVGGNVFVFTAFLTTTFIKAIPGIIIQLILIPVVLKAVERVKKGEAVINE